jgi:hypothetical protein
MNVGLLLKISVCCAMSLILVPDTSTDIIWKLKLRYCTGCLTSNTMTKRDVDKGFGGNNSQLQDTGSAAKTQEKGKGTCQR